MTEQVNVCVPVLRRYDLLLGMLRSLHLSTVLPTVWVFDNGRDAEMVQTATRAYAGSVVVKMPEQRTGIAECWNWFIQNVKEPRFIVNDDILFAPRSLEQMLAAEGDIVFAKDCGFSCFLIRDSCVNAIGLFDETISPGYAYYEDVDYLIRIRKHGGVRMVDVTCGVLHLRSQTLAANNAREMQEHHRRFRIAQRNMIAKWGEESGLVGKV